MKDVHVEMAPIFKKRPILFLLAAALLCLSIIPIATAIADDINYSAVCKLTPNKPSYSTGESIQFTLNAQYATPGDPSKPQTVKFGIPLPDTTPAVQLPMFYLTGSGANAGVPMYPLNYNGITTDLYLKTDDSGKRWIEFTLDAGSTVQGTLSMILPNGVSNSIPSFSLVPEILSEGDYGDNKLLLDGATAVTAQFGWNDVNKIADTDNIGVIGAETKNPDRISYSITANSQSSGLATGRIFADRYVLTDTINLFGLHYADGVLTQSEADGISTFSVGDTPVLEIAAPLSSLTVTKQISSGQITAFDIEYAVHNASLGKTDGTAEELPNLNLSVDLLLPAMQLNPGNEETKVTNSAKFDAYSPFGDHHESTASHTAYTLDRYLLTKNAYSDEACTQPADLVEDGDFVFYKITATNNSAGDGPFTITDVLPNGLEYIDDDCSIPVSESNKTLTWGGLTIPSSQSMTIVLKTQFHAADFTDLLTLHNVANLYNANRLLISAGADSTFLTGEDYDSEITYAKTVNKPFAGMDENLVYSITVRNTNRNVAKLVTVVDKWPGNAIIPTSVTGCERFMLLDAAGTEYSLEQVTANPAINITHIKCYNVYVPASGSTKLTITGKIKEVLDELVNIVGEGTPGEVSAKSYGVSISKAAYAYNATSWSLGDKLSFKNPVKAGDIVCYEMAIKNLKEADIEILELIDKLPVGLSLHSVNFNGVTSNAVLLRNGVYSQLTVSGEDSTNNKTTESFRVNVGETVRVYLFARVSQEAVDASINTSQRIQNAAFARFNSVQTGDAKVNIYTDVNTERKISMDKWFRFVADYDDELHYAGTWLQKPTGEDVQSAADAKTATVWNGAYVGYQLQIKNSTAVGGDNIDVYEIIDDLPAGTEFVGVAKNGSRHYFYSGDTPVRDLAGELIFDGETAAWKAGSHSANLKCTYDQDANQLRIQFLDANNAPTSVSVPPSSSNDYKLFMLIVARVKDDSEFTSYTNTAKIKVDKDVAVVKPDDNEIITVDEYNYISASCNANTLPMTPGIFKQFIGHYFLLGENFSDSVETDPSITPGESLRFAIQVKNQGLDNNPNAVNASLQDFTVTDIIPAEYTYREGSAKVDLNVGYNTLTGLPTGAGTSVINRGSFEPAQEFLADGRTKLTWTFSGKAMRLMCDTLNSSAGFMHLITYDTNWKKTYLPQYGNYLNSASVNHSQKFVSVSTGSPDYDDNSIASSVVVNVFGAAGTLASKAVTNEANQTATCMDDVPYLFVSGEDAKATYTLKVTNATTTAQNSTTQSLVIIDELPRAANDTGVVNRVNRGSQFSVLFDNEPNISVERIVGINQIPVDSGEYTVRYGDSVGALNSNGDWTDDEENGRITWVKKSDGKNAVRIAFQPDFSLGSGESILVRFTARVSGDADPGEIAWNSFGYSYKALVEGNLSEKIFAEPPRVGIMVPGAALSVTKNVTGDTVPSAALFTFQLKKDGAAAADVKYTLSGDTEVHRTNQDGLFTLSADQTATLFVAPADGYTVEETSLPDGFTLIDISAATEGDGTYDAPLYTFKALANGDTVGAICINDYTPRDLTVSKLWEGQPNPNQPASVRVQLYKDSVAEGDPVVLDANNSWQYTWNDLDATKSWTVDELDDIAGYSTLITGDEINGFVITNTYNAQLGLLTLSKEVRGSIGDKTKDWTFTVSFSDNGIYSYYGSKTGTLASGSELTLKHGQTVTFSDIPYGVDYSISEKEANADGYTTTSTGASGTINGDATASFVNSKGLLPNTGDESNPLLWAVILLASSISLCLISLNMARRRVR